MARMVHISYPLLLLDEQFRIVDGGNDLANEIIYRSKIMDGPNSQPINHQFSVRIENYITSSFSIRPSPQNRVWPILFDVSGTFARRAASKSKFNHGMTGFFVEKLLTNVAGLQAKDSLFLVPYLAQKAVLEEAIASRQAEFDSKGINISVLDLETSTAVSFQGWEKLVVIWCLVSN